MGNCISTAGRATVELEELEIELRGAGDIFATLVGKMVMAEVDFTYRPGNRQRRMGGAMEDFDEPEFSEVEIASIKTFGAESFFCDGLTLVMNRGFDLTQVLSRRQIEEVEETLLNRTEAN
jgi:hypothetical protein